MLEKGSPERRTKRNTLSLGLALRRTKAAAVVQDRAGFAAGSGDSDGFPPADGLFVKVMAALLDKQYLYMALGMVNIYASNTADFNPSCSHFPLLSVLINTTIKRVRKKGSLEFPSSALSSFGEFNLSACFLL